MTNLYRHYNTTGILLYVGISLSAIRRLSQHSNRSRWFNQIAMIKIEKFESRDEAQFAEKQAIENEGPLFNIKMVPKKPELPEKVRAREPVLIETDRLLTFREVHEMIGSSCKTAHIALGLAKRGMIESVRFNERTIRFRESSVRKLVAGKVAIPA